jgi:glycosyltransferase involved in cell wall biosynthesis
MYTIVIGVPFRRVDQDVCEVAADWATSLQLLRNSFNGRFGRLCVAAPELPAADGLVGNQTPTRLSAKRDDVEFRSLGLATWRARDFWRHHGDVKAACVNAIEDADVVHAGISNLYKPFSLEGFRAATRARRTTVFVMDGDAVTRNRDLADSSGVLNRVRSRGYSAVLERLGRACVKAADLSLLKGELLMARYQAHARNAKTFYDTSYAASEVIQEHQLSNKALAVQHGPVRLLSLGRLVGIKNTHLIIEAVAEAVRRGADVHLDIIGGGPEESRLRVLRTQLELQKRLRFLGSMLYSPELLLRLQCYHVMLFASTAEETPRALFDAMAGGCALVSFDIPFAREVIGRYSSGLVSSRGSVTGLADAVCALVADRGRLAMHMAAARAASIENTAEIWYRRRAEWTIEAHNRRWDTRV